MSHGDTREIAYLSDIQQAPKEASQTKLRLTNLNERLDTLQRNHLPPTPFLLTIQSRRQFHLSEHQHQEVKEKDCGFKSEEREHQYLSFLQAGWDNTIFTVLKLGQRTKSVDKSRAMASAASKTVAKKISMNDYKKRSSLPPTPSTNGSPAVDEPRNRAVSSVASLSQSSTGLKRSSDSLGKTKLQVANSEEPPSKKFKVSPHLGPSSIKDSGLKHKTTLPPPLSPTLPAFVERLLARSDTSPSKATNTEHNGSVKKTKQLNEKTKVSTADVSSKRTNDAIDLRKTPSEPSRPSMNGTNISHNVNSKPGKSSSTDSDTIKLAPRESSVSIPSVILKLKIPRERRKDVSRLIKLPPKRIKERTPIPKHTSQSEKTISSKTISVERSADKRPREDDTLEVHHDRKRSKSPALQDRATSKKPRESTPVVREEVTTPQGAVLTGTPIPPSSASRLGHKHTPSESGSINSFTSDRLEGLQKLQTKYSELGRSLKKEGDKLSGPDITKAQKKKFIASRIEVTLAFMLSYTIGDEVNRLRKRLPKPEATWNSLFLWLRPLHDLVQEHSHLSGLLLQLEAISIMVVWRQRTEIAENMESLSMDRFKELKAQWDDAQKKFVRGSAILCVDDLQDDFPKTWKSKARQPLANAEYKMAKDNLNGDFYLPLTSISLPIEGVRAGKTLLAEWCRREGVEWAPKLEF